MNNAVKPHWAPQSIKQASLTQLCFIRPEGDDQWTKQTDGSLDDKHNVKIVDYQD